MKRALQAFGVVMLFSITAPAQDMPRVETALRYTYTRVNSDTNVPAFSANGGGGDFVVNFNPWLGFVADLGIAKNGNIDDRNIDSIMFPFLFGPRITMRKSERWIPYFQYLLGGAYTSSSTSVDANIAATPIQPIFVPGLGEVTDLTAFSGRISASQTAFAMALGGGFDIKLSRHVSFRPIALDWLMTRFQNYRTQDDNNQHNLRYSVGFNFTLGAQ
jgi:hypothetical protein